MTLEEMKKVKRARGYSLAQLSEYSGVPLGTLQKIFSGETECPRYATRQAIEKALLERDVRYDLTPKDTPRVEEPGVGYTTEKVKQQGDFTLEDYYTLPDDRRVELIDGVIYDMSAPSFVHQHILGTFFVEVQNFISAKRGKCLPMMAPVDVRLSGDDKTMVQPDMLILCDKSKIQKWGVLGAPDFCLEITSDSTGRKDYIKKLHKYIDAGVREYWIIDPKRRVLVYYHWKDDYLPHMCSLQGKVGLAIYDDELQIDLDRLADLIQEYPDEE